MATRNSVISDLSSHRYITHLFTGEKRLFQEMPKQIWSRCDLCETEGDVEQKIYPNF
jgi:hypothetical protein